MDPLAAEDEYAALVLSRLHMVICQKSSLLLWDRLRFGTSPLKSLGVCRIVKGGIVSPLGGVNMYIIR